MKREKFQWVETEHNNLLNNSLHNAELVWILRLLSSLGNTLRDANHLKTTECHHNRDKMRECTNKWTMNIKEMIPCTYPGKQMTSNRELLKATREVITISKKIKAAKTTFKINIGSQKQHLGRPNKMSIIINRDSINRRNNRCQILKIFSNLREYTEGHLMNYRLRHLPRGKWLQEVVMITVKRHLALEVQQVSYNTQMDRELSSKVNLGKQGRDLLASRCFILMVQWEKVVVSFTGRLLHLDTYYTDQYQSTTSVLTDQTVAAFVNITWPVLTLCTACSWTPLVKTTPSTATNSTAHLSV